MKSFNGIYVVLLIIVTCASISILLGTLSGWFFLARKYPDHRENAIFKLSGLSGMMGFGAGFRYILKLSTCPSGLRVGVNPIFGIFCKDFFVPWEMLTITRSQRFWGKVVQLKFKDARVGHLYISGYIANQLARSIPEKWPEIGPLPEETSKEILQSIFNIWLSLTFVVSTFFYIVSRKAVLSNARPSVPVIILFPAIVIGIFLVIEYSKRIQGTNK